MITQVGYTTYTSDKRSERFPQGHFVPLWVIYITSNYLHAGGWSTTFSSVFNLGFSSSF
ncbi:hypothetical protein RhiirC2_795580 [Rhizophagus irregularis]|uniref:Uncharacterized protein n=1 Tax=Rhizophagus irregularis TaxID=588596 RepID=A0A2N1MB89_9GLOM|nr:hypothetical protein RhiirC2_795580 [Rhizophagus irregularis]